MTDTEITEKKLGFHPDNHEESYLLTVSLNDRNPDLDIDVVISEEEAQSLYEEMGEVLKSDS